jgi:GDP-4-dehydro-6-deoxy-D-mannose reductase
MAERATVPGGTSAGVLPFERILVTGADGFVGKYLMPRLDESVSRGAAVWIATRAPLSDSQVYLDLGDADAICAAVEQTRPDLIIHLAAQSSVGASDRSAAETWSINHAGTMVLAQATARICPESTFFFVSSTEVYGRSFNKGPASEDSDLVPTNAYARSKAAAEWALGDILPETAKLIVVRPTNHTGPGQDERFVLSSFSSQIARIEAGLVPPRLLVGQLDAERDFLDVRDVVSGYLALLTSSRLGSRNLFNISSGKTYRIGALLAVLLKLSSREIEVVVDPGRLRKAEVPRAAIDSDRFRQFADWHPEHPIEATLATLLDFQRGVVAGRDGS